MDVEDNSQEHQNEIELFASFSLLMEAHSKLLEQEPDEADKSPYLAEVKAFFDRARETGTVLANVEERRTAQSILNYWLTVLYRANIVRPEQTKLAEYNPNVILKLDQITSPYPGVRAFREDEERFFFGRQRQINYLMGRLREDRFLAIAGPSGVGKTSLLVAGLLPEIKQRDKSEGIQRHYLPVISPGHRPLENLIRLLGSQVTNSINESHFRKSPDALLRLIESFAEFPVLIPIDQFEEVFTQANEEDRHHFIANVARVIQTDSARHTVILTMRDDNYDAYLRRPDRFRKALEPAKISLPQMGALDLREAIEKPAALVPLKFQPTTIENLVKEIISEPAGLPLLQFALTQLWEKREGNTIPDAAFTEMGGCRQAVMAKAEKFFGALDGRDQRRCRKLITRLVKLDSDLRPQLRSASRAELYAVIGNEAAAESLIEKLRGEQLLRVQEAGARPDDAIELVHASLLTTWKRMQGWIEDKRRFRFWRRIAAGVVLTGLLLLVVLWTFIGWGQLAQRAQSREVVRESIKQFNHNRLDLALLYGREAYAVDDNAVTRGNLLKLLYALQSGPHPRHFFYYRRQDKNFEANDLVFSSETVTDPGKVAAIDQEGDVVVWNLAQPDLEPLVLSTKNASAPIAFSTDGNWIATGSDDQDVMFIWDLKTQTSKTVNSADLSTVTTLTFAPDNKHLMTGSKNGKVIRWDLTTPEPTATTLYNHEGDVLEIAFSPTGKLMASGGQDGKAILSDGQSNKSARKMVMSQQFTGSSEIFSLSFNGETALAAGGYNEVFIWDLNSREQTNHLSMGVEGSGVIVSYDSTGGLLAGFGMEGLVVVWDVNSGSVVSKEYFNDMAIHGAALSRNGHLLALPTSGGIEVCDVINERGLQPGSVLNMGNRINLVGFSPDKQFMAAAGVEGSLTLWNLKDAERDAGLGSQTPDLSTSTFAFSNDGKTLAVGSFSGTISLREITKDEVLKSLNAETGRVAAPVSPDDDQEPGAIPAARSRVVKISFDPTPASSRLAALIELPPGREEAKPEEEAKKDSQRIDPPTKLILWDTTQSTATELEHDDKQTVTSMAFSGDGQILAWGIADRGHSLSGAVNTKSKIILWSQGAQRKPLDCEARVISLATSPAGSNQQRKILAAGLENGKVLMWDLTTLRNIGHPLEDQGGKVTDLAFSSDGRTLATVTNSYLTKDQPGLITLFDVDTQEQLGSPLVGHKGKISSIAMSPNGNMIASASDSEIDYRIILWDLDIQSASRRFCSIITCPNEPTPALADKVSPPSALQLLYRKVSNWW